MHHARRENKHMKYMYFLLVVLLFAYLCFYLCFYFHFGEEIYLETFNRFVRGGRDFNASI